MKYYSYYRVNFGHVFSNDILYSNINTYFSHYYILERQFFSIFSIFILIFTIYKDYDRKRKYIDTFETFCLERKESILLVKDTGRACKQRNIVTGAFTVSSRVQVRRVHDMNVCIWSHASLFIYICLQVVKSQRRRERLNSALPRDKTTVSVLSGPNRANQPLSLWLLHT